MDISKNACEILSIAYNEFLNRRKLGNSIMQSSQFKDINSFYESFCADRNYEDVKYGLFELRKHNLIAGMNYDNTLYNISITNLGLTALENAMQKNKSALIHNIMNFSGLLFDVLSLLP